MSTIRGSILGVCVAVCSMTAGLAEAQTFKDDDVLLDDVPDDVMATMETRDRLLAALPRGDGPILEFLIEDFMRWEPGSTVKVAFLGGNKTLHQEIADATKSITDHANLTLDFGLDPATGEFRKWTTSDTTHAAEIRVSFDQSGFFSLVGRDSIDTNIGSPLGAVGGRAHQRSLNLGGFHIAKPASWRKTVRHEFLHALAFHHEHQSPMGGCDAQFRWEDDPDYVPTRDLNGRFVADEMGRQPGIYTYLSGAPNFWGKSKVDHNLRGMTATPGFTAGEFDRASIMLYRFPAIFYKTPDSPCSPLGTGEDLSDGDRAGLAHLYPHDSDAVSEIADRRGKAVKALQDSAVIQADFKASLLNSLE